MSLFVTSTAAGRPWLSRHSEHRLATTAAASPGLMPANPLYAAILAEGRLPKHCSRAGRTIYSTVLCNWEAVT